MTGETQEDRAIIAHMLANLPAYGSRAHFQGVPELDEAPYYIGEDGVGFHFRVAGHSGTAFLDMGDLLHIEVGPLQFRIEFSPRVFEAAAPGDSEPGESSVA